MGVLKRLDAGVHRVEKALAASLFLLMAVVVFINVTHRVFSRPEGRLSGVLLRTLERFGVAADPATIHGPVSIGLNLLLAWLLSYAVLRTVVREPRFTRAQSLLGGLALAAVAGALVKAVLVLFPAGLVWGNVAAMACMLWVGFLGASVSTYERKHLTLEIGEKIWPRKLLPAVRALALLIATAFVGGLLALALLSEGDHIEAWRNNPLAGNLLPTTVPKWVVFLIFPYTFTVMGLRLLAQAFTAPPVEAQE